MFAQVQRGLVDGNNLRLALQLMLTAVKEQSPKMLTFGVNALLVCQERLTSLPQICQAVLQVPNLRPLHDDHGHCLCDLQGAPAPWEDRHEIRWRQNNRSILIPERHC